MQKTSTHSLRIDTTGFPVNNTQATARFLSFCAVQTWDPGHQLSKAEMDAFSTFIETILSISKANFKIATLSLLYLKRLKEATSDLSSFMPMHQHMKMWATSFLLAFKFLDDTAIKQSSWVSAINSAFSHSLKKNAPQLNSLLLQTLERKFLGSIHWTLNVAHLEWRQFGEKIQALLRTWRESQLKTTFGLITPDTCNSADSANVNSAYLIEKRNGQEKEPESAKRLRIQSLLN